MKLHRRNYLLTSLFCVILILASIPIILADIEPMGTGSDHWIVDSLVYDDNSNEESWPSLATDSNGNIYVAYQHYDSGFERFRIYVSTSTDGGQTWTLFYTIQKSTSLMNPSIAIDPHDNRVYVAYEEEISTSDHDILCSVYTGTGWIERVVDDDTQNDRFPSIVSDFQFGSSNYQYISYEKLYSYNDRDIYVAKSIDHGNTWPQWHYGNLGGYVLTQTWITTNQDGHVYLAAAVSPDYADHKWLNIYYGDRASTSGWFENLAQPYNAAMAAGHGANSPSMVASHNNPNLLVVVFQRYITSTNDDVCYAYTDDGGTTWYWGNISNTGYNERHPTITVDGQGSTSTSVAGYFRVAYYYGLFIHYKQAYDSTPTSWNAYPARPNPISGGPGTGANDAERSISIITQKDDADIWWPNIVWTDNRGSSQDLYSTTTGNNPIIPEFPSFLILPLFMIATLLAVIVYRRRCQLPLKSE